MTNSYKGTLGISWNNSETSGFAAVPPFLKAHHLSLPFHIVSLVLFILSVSYVTCLFSSVLQITPSLA